MYKQFWRLQANPFENDMDSRFFFRSSGHQAALLKLRYVLENRQGAGLLAGGVGYGKTYLVSQLFQELPEHFGPVVSVVYPNMSPPEMLAYLADELGDEPPADSLDQVIHQLEGAFVQLSRQGRHPAIVVDDAHLIADHHIFQAFQLLLNFQQKPEIDFSLLLLGDRILLGEVQRMAQLHDRIATTSMLRPFSQKDTAQYIAHRLAMAGAKSTIFEDSALQSVFELSGGVPRKINRLCDLALLVGFAEGMSRLTSTEIEAVSEELTAVLPESFH